jgi:hypothetical protein
MKKKIFVKINKIIILIIAIIKTDLQKKITRLCIAYGKKL